MTLLSIVQDAASEVGLPQPASVINNTDPTAMQLLTLVNRTGKEMARRYDWTVLRKETSFPTVAAETQTALPSDYDRMADDSMWDRTAQRKIYGPQTPQLWQADKAFISTRIYSVYRIRGKSILFQPNPAAGDSIYYEYLSLNWVDTNADGLGDAALFSTSDNYTSVLDEMVLTLGVIARLKETKGLPYAENFRRYEHQMQLLAARDGSKPPLRMAGVRPWILGHPTVPDHGYG